MQTSTTDCKCQVWTHEATRIQVVSGQYRIRVAVRRQHVELHTDVQCDGRLVEHKQVVRSRLGSPSQSVASAKCYAVGRVPEIFTFRAVTDTGRERTLKLINNGPNISCGSFRMQKAPIAKGSSATSAAPGCSGVW